MCENKIKNVIFGNKSYTPNELCNTIVDFLEKKVSDTNYISLKELLPDTIYDTLKESRDDTIYDTLKESLGEIDNNSAEIEKNNLKENLRKTLLKIDTNNLDKVCNTPDQMSLQDRMKIYESILDIKMEGHGYLVVRLDGKGFSKFTKKYFKNKDTALSQTFNKLMFETTKYLISEIPECVFGYTHSDEINLILTDIYPNYKDTNSDRYIDKWYGWRLNKILSIIPSMASSYFTSKMCSMTEGINTLYNPSDIIIFDSRCVFLQSLTEAVNNIIWRSQVNIRNAKMQFAQKYCSHNELLNLTADEAINLVNEKTNNQYIWINNISHSLKYGYYIFKSYHNSYELSNISYMTDFIADKRGFYTLRIDNFNKFEKLYAVFYKSVNEGYR